MEIEMGMKAEEDIGIGEDVIKGMKPLCWAVHDSNDQTTLTNTVLRAALALLRLHQPSNPDRQTSSRIAGLQTNRRHLMTSDILTEFPGADDPESESAMCAVLNNSVEVGVGIGIAVYGPEFSWINHSCSPNACYSFEAVDGPQHRPRIVPYSLSHSSHDPKHVSKHESLEGVDGPRLRLRTIKRIPKDDPLTIAYTDVLQPKGLRQSELLSKYGFLCCCTRCGAVPPTYVDRVLEEIHAVGLKPCSSSMEKATELLTQYVDDAVREYLLNDDPQSCCEKLERVLTRGLCGEVGVSYWLHPLHHLSLQAYTALASAYKTCGNLVAASAYSLLLAGATNHLFRSEPSLIASTATYWVNAGESLLSFAKTLGFMPHSSTSQTYHRCFNCSLQNYDRGAEIVSREFLNCVSLYAQSVWGVLVRGCNHLTMFDDPFEFGWLDDEGKQYWTLRDNNASSETGSDKLTWSYERNHLFQLASHCLLYGGCLGTTCFGENSYLTTHAHAILSASK